MSKAHRLTRKLWQEAHLEDVDVAIIPALLGPESEPSMKQLRACRPYLLRGLQALRPLNVICMGKHALRAITNSGRGSVTEYRGVVISAAAEKGVLESSPPVYTTYHPDGVISGGESLRPRIVEDFARIKWGFVPPPSVGKPRGRVAIDMEYGPDRAFLAMAVADAEVADAYDIASGGDIEDIHEAVTGARKILGHNVAVDVDHLIQRGLGTSGLVRGESTLDTFLLAKMADENRGAGNYKLEVLLRSFFNVEPWKNKTEIYSEYDATKWPPELRRERCRLDAWAAAKLAEPLIKQVQADNLPPKLVRFQHRLALTLHRIHHAGAKVNMDKLAERAAYFRQEADKFGDLIQREAFQHGMTSFSATNPNHIRELLFKKMKLKSHSKTEKTNLPSTAAKDLAVHQDIPVVDALIKFKKFKKVLCTWYEKGESKRPGAKPLVELIDEHGLLHFNLIPLGARTWRRASVAPNSQNWPEEVRQIIVSRWDGGTILNVDYEKLEPTIMSWVVDEQKMYQHFTEGEGYIGIGKDFFGKTIDKKSNDYRMIKSIVLGIGYGMGPWTLAKNLEDAGIPLAKTWDGQVKEAERLVREYLRMFPQLRRYMRRKKTELIKHQRSVAPSGAIRHLPCPHGEATQNFQHLRNEAINFPIQHIASLVTGSALLDVEEALVRKYSNNDWVGYHKRLLESPHEINQPVLINEVHDSLIVDLPPNHSEDIDIIVRTMRGLPSLRRILPKFPLKPSVEHIVSECWRSK